MQEMNFDEDIVPQSHSAQNAKFLYLIRILDTDGRFEWSNDWKEDVRLTMSPYLLGDTEPGLKRARGPQCQQKLQ